MVKKKTQPIRREQLEAYIAEVDAYAESLRDYMRGLDTGTTPPGQSPPKPPKLPK